MKNPIFLLLFLFASLIFSGQQALRFVHISDTHIGSPNGNAEEDLRRTINDINSRNDIDFVVITGDITELGTDAELQLAKKLFDGLQKKWYIIPGNHDSGWSESGGDSFIKTFGYDKFVFDHAGIRFIGCASGPYVRMSDGHVPRNALVWMDSILKKTSVSQPLIFLNHYPLDPGLDNWYEITSRLNRYHTLAALCGHGHANKMMNFDSIPAFMGRSNLRAKAEVGGFNIVDIRNDSIIYTEHRPGTDYYKTWGAMDLKKGNSVTVSKKPDFSINEKYPAAKTAWTFSSDANVISTPLVMNGLVIFGNQDGKVEAISLQTGKPVWTSHTSGSIFSSPAAYKENLILGSADGSVYCFNATTGNPVWKFTGNASFLGSPLVQDDRVYIGGSDHKFHALDAQTGKEIWQFDGLDGPVVSKPVIHDDKIIFGAWDRHLYALNKNTGELFWKWNNGSAVRNYSPAACVPVIANGAVFIVAPDRYVSAIDLETGQTIWRNNDATVRESMGASQNRKLIYGKTMQDTIVAYRTSREKQYAVWKMNCGFGYEHSPSVLWEKKGLVYFGTRNGVVYCINPKKKTIVWAHKIDNSMVNTLNLLDKKTLVAATMDGKVVLLKIQ